MGYSKNLDYSQEKFLLILNGKYHSIMYGGNYQFCKDSLTVSLRGHLRIHETFIVDQNKNYFLHNYQMFSIKSYVVAIY